MLEDVQRAVVPSHIAEEAVVGGLWTDPRLKKEVWWGLV